jgi:ubiquinone/menaquinone biosynthesis C-methylase UbiE
MNPNKALWEKGDFTRIAKSMRASGADLVSKLGIVKGMKMMDLGCGDGTTAIPAAKLGAIVTGVDIAQNLVAAGNKRVEDEGIPNCSFQEGDACELTGIADASFDISLSVWCYVFNPSI